MGFLSGFRKLFQRRQQTKVRRRRLQKRGVDVYKKRKRKGAWKIRNKKLAFTLRVDEELLSNFMKLCERRDIFVNEIIEIFMRDTLYKDSVERVRTRVIRARAKIGK